MATVREDLRQRHRVSEDRGAYTAQRVFYVTGLAQPPELQIMEALQDPQIPLYLAQYPLGSPSAFPVYDNMRVRQRDGEPYGANGVIVTVTYSNVARSNFNSLEPPVGDDGPDLKRISSAVDQRKTTRDRQGNAMTLTPGGVFLGDQAYDSEAEAFVAVGELVFFRTEKNPPAARMRNFVGKVNSIIQDGYPARTLLCWSIEADSQDGELWDVEYVFRYRPDGWEHRDTWKRPDGKPAAGQVEQTFELLDETSFNVLGLDFSDNQNPW